MDPPKVKQKLPMMRKFQSFKTKGVGKANSNKSSTRSLNSSSKRHNGSGDSYRLGKQNRALANALNSSKLQASALTKKINELMAENMDLRAQVAELRQDINVFMNAGTNEGSRSSVTEIYGPNGSYHRANLEVEFQKRLAEYLAPLKAHLHQGLGNIVSLSDNLSQAMQLATAPGRNSKSLSSINFCHARATGRSSSGVRHLGDANTSNSPIIRSTPLEPVPDAVEPATDIVATHTTSNEQGIEQSNILSKPRGRKCTAQNTESPSTSGSAAYPFTPNFLPKRSIGLPNWATAKVTPMVKGILQ